MTYSLGKPNELVAAANCGNGSDRALPRRHASRQHINKATTQQQQKHQPPREHQPEPTPRTQLPAPSILQKPVLLRARSAPWVRASGLNPTQQPNQTPHLPLRLRLQLRLHPPCHRNPHPSRPSHPLRRPKRAARQPPNPVEAAMAHRLPDRGGRGRHVFDCTSSLDYAGRRTRRTGSRSDCVIGPQNPKLVRLMASSAQIRSLDAGGTRNDTWRNFETEGNRRLQPIRDKERGRRNEHQWRVLIKLQHSKDTG
jgi:hypothetical protein